MTPQALLTHWLAYFPTFPQLPNSIFNIYDPQNSVDLLSKHFDSVSKTCMSAFLVDLMNFKICRTFQAQDRTCMSFFLVDLLSKRFDSVYKTHICPLFSLTWWIYKFAKISKLRIGHVCLFFSLICCQSILTVILRHVCPLFLLTWWLSKFSKLSKLRIGHVCLFFLLICCQSILTVILIRGCLLFLFCLTWLDLTWWIEW